MFSLRSIIKKTFCEYRIYKVFNQRSPNRLCSSSPVIDLSSSTVTKYLDNINNEYWALHTKVPLSRNEYNRMKELQPIVKILEERMCILDNLKNLDELNTEGSKDQDMVDLMKEEKEIYKNVLSTVDNRLKDVMFSKNMKFGISDSIIEISAGVGGQEAMLFAREMFDMYVGYSNFKKWNCQVSQLDTAEMGGVRKAVIFLSGEGTYEIMKIEAGVHRVQRIPATEKGGRLHTSTVSVAVLLQPNEVEVIIPDRDIKIETKRATGAGGQHVNTTDSAVRVVHIPTGLAVECQSERNQIQNKTTALARLRALLYEQQQEKMIQQERAERKSQVGSSLRNEKIRTYNYNQDRITDHRIGASEGTVHGLKPVLEGGIALDNLINRLHHTFHKRNLLYNIEAMKSETKQ